MSSNAQDEYFDEYNKPGAERSRRRRGTDEDIESDLEEELLEDDWAPGKKNPSELSDEELNDDLLQSDDEDVNMGGQHVSLNATYSLNTSYEHHDSLQEDEYTGDVGDDGYQQGEYAEDYGQDAEVPEDPMEYNEELGQEEEGYQDGVLDIQINEPLDGEFQDSEYQSSYNDEPLHEDAVQQEEAPEEVGLGGEQQEEEEAADSSQVFNTEVETEEAKEESDEEDDDTEESGRLRFKSERKESVGVRLADAGSKRRNIPETLELSEKAKQDLKEFEEQERQRRQNRYGGRGGGRGGGGGGGGRGGRGRGGFGMSDFRGGHRGRMNDYRVPLMGNMGLQPSSRIPPHQSHQQQLQSQQHHPSRPRGPPPPFQEVGRPLVQQSLQPLIPPHMAHRSSPLRQMEPQPPRMMSPQPPSFSQHRQQPPQPKNIHINPHFRGPSSSSVQVPLMPPAQSQPRPAVGPQRFPGPGDFQQHMPDNFGQAQRPPHHIEPFRNHPPHGPQDRNPHFMPEHTDSPRFPGPHMFDHPSPLLNNNNNSVHQQLSGPGHMSFGPPGPAFNQSNQGPAGLFSRDPPRPNHPPHQGHQGMVGMNQQGGPPNQPRPCLGPRQPFGQQGALFPPPSVQFGMQVRLRGLMPGPPVSQLPHHDSLSSHQPLHQHQHHQQQQHQHHRQELPHHHHLPHQQQQRNLVEPRPMMHHGQHPFHQQQGHGGPRPMTPRPQNPQQRNMSNKQRMNTPVSKQMQLRNSNLRELPVAPGNMSVNSAQPISSPTPSVRPVARATQGARPGQNIQPAPNRGRGRGQVPANTESQPGAAGRAVVHKEVPSTASAKTQEDPDEDEETRQYRLKIEEQKRLREEILKRKEQRRQMQAGARKKELMERLNSLAPNTQSEGPTPPTLPTQHNLQTANPVQQQAAAAAAPRQQQLQPQPQRPFPQRPQQSSSQCLKTPNQDPAVHPNGAAPQPNVKTHLQLPKGGGGGGGGGGPQTQTPGLLPNQQWKQPQQNQPPEQRGISAAQNVNRPGAQVQKNIPVLPSSGPGLAGPLSHGPQPGAKRTVMQRAKNPDAEGQQVPQKVLRVSGAGGKGPEVTAAPLQQQGNCPTTALNQRKVTMTGQKPQGAGRPPQAGPQQNRVVVTGRGRGGGPMGRGRTVPTRQSPRVAESQRSTVSIEGLSLSTTETQLRNLLRSIGPIEMFKMMPQQRKAVATFSNPDHAASFQLSFHRHMIDLSHIDVSLIDG